MTDPPSIVTHSFFAMTGDRVLPSPSSWANDTISICALSCILEIEDVLLLLIVEAVASRFSSIVRQVDRLSRHTIQVCGSLGLFGIKVIIMMSFSNRRAPRPHSCNVISFPISPRRH